MESEGVSLMGKTRIQECQSALEIARQRSSIIKSRDRFRRKMDDATVMPRVVSSQAEFSPSAPLLMTRCFRPSLRSGPASLEPWEKKRGPKSPLGFRQRRLHHFDIRESIKSSWRAL
jgi:hypothetical protein